MRKPKIYKGGSKSKTKGETKLPSNQRIARSYMSDSRRKKAHRRNMSGDYRSMPRKGVDSALFPKALKNNMVFKNPDFRRKDENGKFSSTPKIPKISHDKPGSKGYRGKKRSKKNPNLPSLKSNKMSVSGNSGLAKSKKLNLNNPKEKELMIKRYRYLLRSPNTPKDKLNNFLTLVVRGLHYSTNCLKPPSKKFINSRKLKLRDRPRGKKKTLYLDLDETIIFQCKDGDKATFEVPIDNNEVLRFSARPHWKKFLNEVGKLFEIVIFTASTQYYAQLVSQTLDPDNKYFNGILSRNHCMLTKNGFFIKDLRMVDNRELKDVVLLDNYVHSFAFNIDNGIPILEWRNDPEDDEFLHMIDYFRELSTCEDTRKFNREKLKLYEIPYKTIIS